jgi:transposase InsO family protein
VPSVLSHRGAPAKRPAHPGKTPTTSLAVPLPGTRWHIDHHTNLSLSADGKRHVLVIIDSTSMWPELIAVESTDAETVVRALFDNVVSRFGVPRGFSLLSDNGSAFISELTSLFCKTFRVRQNLPHHTSRRQTYGRKSLRIPCTMRCVRFVVSRRTGHVTYRP